MIIINMKGGLGNQIFQYAAGRALSLRRQQKGFIPEKIKLDINGYSAHNGIDTVRSYSLDVFNVNVEIATNEEIKKLKYPFGIISKGWRFFRAKILRQFNTNFNKNIFNSNKQNIYLDGFFQTEKYFIDQEAEIRRDVTLKNALGSEARSFSNMIKNTPKSVSLHIRRGDYVHDPATNKYWGTCTIDYYIKALETLTSKIGTDIHVFVFSNEVEWVKENMPIPYPVTYVSSPNIKDYEELMLMSLCKHNVIANSSFSWWGAWLNQNPDKIVIAPRRWVLKDESNYKDIVPSSWIRM